jgi:hypothetical protein
MKHHLSFVAALAISAVAAAQQAPPPAEPKESPAKASVTNETPVRQPPTTVDENGKTVPAKTEKLVLADPDSKMYMPCRDAGESSSSLQTPSAAKPSPKSAVLSEEAAKQHGYRPSPHKVVCPK